MILNKKKINQLSRVSRINLMNSITGVKPAILIGTKNVEGNTNLAIFSSIVHISSNPALFGFFTRKTKNHRRDTYENIINTNTYTFNHIHKEITSNAHYTSLKFKKNISEFNSCSFTEEYFEKFYAPFVKESNVKIGLKLTEIIELKSSSSELVIGEVECIITQDSFLEDNILNPQISKSMSVVGLNHYFNVSKEISIPYVRSKDISSIEEISRTHKKIK